MDSLVNLCLTFGVPVPANDLVFVVEDRRRGAVRHLRVTANELPVVRGFNEISAEFEVWSNWFIALPEIRSLLDLQSQPAVVVCGDWVVDPDVAFCLFGLDGYDADAPVAGVAAEAFGELLLHLAPLLTLHEATAVVRLELLSPAVRSRGGNRPVRHFRTERRRARGRRVERVLRPPSSWLDLQRHHGTFIDQWGAWRQSPYR